MEIPALPPAIAALELSHQLEPQLSISGGLGGSTRHETLFSMTLGGSDGGDVATLRRGSSEIMCVSSFLHPSNPTSCSDGHHSSFVPLFAWNKLLARALGGQVFHALTFAVCIFTRGSICRMYVPAAPQPGSPIPPMPEPFEESEPTQLEMRLPFGSNGGELDSDNQCASLHAFLTQH